MKNSLFIKGTKGVVAGLLFVVLNSAAGNGRCQQVAWVKSVKENPSDKEVRMIEIDKGNYLVVGSFSFLANAKNYVNFLRNTSNNAQLGYYPSTNRYYVYLLQSPDINKVRAARDNVRKDKQFYDAWVLSLDSFNNLKEEGASEWAKTRNSSSNLLNAPSEPQTQNVTKADNKTAGKSESIKIEVPSNRKTASKVKEFKIYVNSFDANSYKELNANVKLIFGEQDKLVGSMESHKLQSVLIPVEDVKEIQLEANFFGYRKAIHDLNLENPVNPDSKSYLQVMGDSLVFNFELIPYKKGDIFTMYNVFFHNDAAIMLPKSAYEANSLLAMIKQNDRLKIKLHGHTNGNAFGKIVKMSEGDKDFFNLRPTNENGVGSAKKLSYERALTIKNYLVSEGIDEKRIEVIGWGGKKMVYQNDSNEAKKNARVEVEILQD